MDIVDSQVHLGPGGAAELVAKLDALGIASAFIDEWWMGTPGLPGYRLANGAFRAVSPTVELAARNHATRARACGRSRTTPVRRTQCAQLLPLAAYAASASTGFRASRASRRSSNASRRSSPVTDGHG